MAKKLSMITLPLFLASISVSPTRFRLGTDGAASDEHGKARHSNKARMTFFIIYPKFLRVEARPRRARLHKLLGGLYRTYGVSAICICANGIGKSLGNSRPTHQNLDGQTAFPDNLDGVFHTHHGGGHQGR